MRKSSELRDYQHDGSAFLREREKAMLIGDIGTGKTVTALTAIRQLQMMGRTKAVVIAPKRVCETVWAQEAKEWVHTLGMNVRVATGSPVARMAALSDPQADVVCLNYENLVWALNEHERTGLLAAYTVLVVDELSFFKNTNTQRYKQLRKHIGTFNHRWGLTGTPAPNSLMDLFPQTFIIDGGERFGRTVTAFKNEYFIPVDRMGYTWAPRRGAEEAIYRKMEGLTFRVTAKDHLQMPQVQSVTVTVPLPESVMRQYRELSKEDLIVIDGEEIFGTSEAGVGQKLQQIGQGRVYDEKGAAHWVHDFRLNACQDVVGSLAGQPVIIAYHYKHDLAALKSAWPNAPVMSETADAPELISDWNAGRVPVLLTHPAAAAHGLNMQGGGHHLIWYCQTWSLELHDQLIGRLVRPGQASDRVIVHYLVSPRTRDVDAVRVLQAKARTQRDLLDALCF